MGSRQKDGIGEYKYKNGDADLGSWKDDRRHEFGEMRYSNRSVYSRNWEKSKQHGQGKFEFAKGDIYEGLWEHGTYYPLNGENRISEWRDGNKCQNRYDQKLSICHSSSHQAGSVSLFQFGQFNNYPITFGQSQQLSAARLDDIRSLSIEDFILELFYINISAYI